MVEQTDRGVRRRVEEATQERSSEEIRHAIAAQRDSISQTVDSLGERLHQTLDWREYVADHPYAALGVAAGLGFLIAGVFRPHPTSPERILQVLAESAEELIDRFRDDLPLEKKSGLGRAVTATVATAGTKAVLDFLISSTLGYAARKARGQAGRASVDPGAEFEQPI
ncbi:MAG: DUF883 C-terminal domain-containing protein [Chloroflexi bacterium]|nr:DUF883 C-terminal domain-containing protein [Chloroflexota bacterium]